MSPWKSYDQVLKWLLEHEDFCFSCLKLKRCFWWFSWNSHRLNHYGIESPLLCLGLVSFEYNWWILNDLLFNRFRLNKFLFAKFVIFINGLKFDTREWISRFQFQNRESIFGKVPNTNELMTFSNLLNDLKIEEKLYSLKKHIDKNLLIHTPTIYEKMGWQFELQAGLVRVDSKPDSLICLLSRTSSCQLIN